MPGIEKAKPLIILDVIDYLTNSVAKKTIIKKITGQITIMAFDDNQGLAEQTSPFDIFTQVIEGSAEITIDKVAYLLQSGQGIIIPAHSPNYIKPNGRFKMTSTIIKSGYE